MSVQPVPNPTGQYTDNAQRAQPVENKDDSEPPKTASEETTKTEAATPVAAPAPAPKFEVRDDLAPLQLFTQSMDYPTPTCLDVPALVEHQITQIRLEMRASERSELPPLYFDLACCLMAQKNYSEAKGYLRLVHTDSSILAMASCDFYEGNYSAAINRCDPLSLMYTSVQFKMGCCYAKLDNQPAANKCFALVPVNDSSYGRAQFNIGGDFYRRKKFRTAIHYFRNSLNAGVDCRDDANYYLGLCHMKINEMDKAIEHLSQIKNERSPYYQAAQKKLKELNV